MLTGPWDGKIIKNGKGKSLSGTKNNTGDYSPMLNPQYFSSAALLAAVASSSA
nr:MAG TPA: hypothetical protein [Caudoviricetes sp.]